MTNSLSRIAGRLALSAAAVALSVLPNAGIALAQTVPTSAGTVISNTASASYQDGNGNSYTTVSNQVTTTVQFAPTLTNTGQVTNQNIAPNDIVADPFTLKNTGNSTGTFAITAPTLSAGTVQGYAIVGSTTCTVATPCSLAAVNAALAALPTASGGTQTVDVVYKAPPAGATANPQTITDALSATVTYTPATGPTSGLTAATSAPATATDTDNDSPDARLDLQKNVTAPTSATAPITYVINGNDGGSFPAYGSFDALALVKGTADPNETNPGIIVSDKIPVYPAGATVAANTITVQSATVTLNGQTAGTTAHVIYTTDPTGATGWTETLPAGGHVAFVAAYIQNSTASTGSPTIALLPSNPGGSTGAGVVTTATPQVVITLQLTQPTGTGSANAGSVVNIANSVIAGNPDAQGNQPLLGPGIPAGTNDTPTTGTATPITATTGPLQNTTYTPGNGAPGGDSNKPVTSAYAAQQVENGPAGSPAATGSYNGTAAVNDSDDFTTVATACTNNGGVAVNTVPATANCTVNPITVPGTFQNTGNSSDNFTLSVTPPAGYTAQIFPATCTGTPPYATFPVCTASSTTPIGTTPQTVASGASFNYVTVYTPTGNVTPFVPADGVVTVKGTGTTAADTNTTHNELVAGGPLEIVKSVAVTSTNCAAGQTVPATGVCPGGILTYSLAYSTPGNAAQTGAGAGTEPAFALGGFTVNASTATPLTIYEDGTGTYFTAATPTAPAGSTVTANNWATYTFGLQAAAVDSRGAAAFTYFTGNPTTTATTTFATGTYPAISPSGPGSFVSKFTTPLTAGTAGTITFKVQVK